MWVLKLWFSWIMHIIKTVILKGEKIYEESREGFSLTILF